MKWSACRCRSQTTLRRAPRTGRQQAKSVKTGSGILGGIAGMAGMGVIGGIGGIGGIGAAALRDRLAEGGADVAGGAIGPALDEAQDRLRRERRGVDEAVAHRGVLPPGGGEAP